MVGIAGRYITALSELRNDLVHNFRNAEFTLGKWFGALQPSAQPTVAVAFSPFESFLREGQHLPGVPIDPRSQDQATVEKVPKRASEHTKEHIWVGANYVLTSTLDMKLYSEYRQWAKAKDLMD